MEIRPDHERIEGLLREANVLRLRGQAAEAEERCRAVLQLAPDEPTALEMVGDLVRGRGELEEAGELFRKAMMAAPNRPSPETKYAEVTLELAERERLRDAATLMLQRPISAREQRRNVWIALVLSGFFPGLGQFYNHDGIKGTLLVLGSLLCIGIGGTALFRLFFTVATAHPSGPVDSFSAWVGLLSFVLWLYAVIDAVVVAQKRGRAAGGPIG